MCAYNLYIFRNFKQNCSFEILLPFSLAWACNIANADIDAEFMNRRSKATTNDTYIYAQIVWSIASHTQHSVISTLLISFLLCTRLRLLRWMWTTESGEIEIDALVFEKNCMIVRGSQSCVIEWPLVCHAQEQSNEWTNEILTVKSENDTSCEWSNPNEWETEDGKKLNVCYIVLLLCCFSFCEQCGSSVFNRGICTFPVRAVWFSPRSACQWWPI